LTFLILSKDILLYQRIAKSHARMSTSMAKKQQTRSTDAAVLVRMTTDDRETLEAAIKKMLAGIPGAKLGVAGYLLAAGLEKAKGVLGK
jgi:hypothetical protein